MEQPAPDPGAFGPALLAFLEAAVAGAPAAEPPLYARVRDHLGVAPEELEIVTLELSDTDHRNLQVALDALLAEPDWGAELVGVLSRHGGMMPTGMAEIVDRVGPGPLVGGAARPGPVGYVSAQVEPGRTIDCVSAGLFLLAHGDRRLAAAISRADRGMEIRVRLDVLAPERDEARALVERLRGLMRERNVFRSRAVSFLRTEHGRFTLELVALPDVARDAVVLPDGVLEAIERHVIGPERHAERLRAAGRHLKRGLLLHGPPGTGKTLTAMYLAGRMPGRTVVTLTGEAFGAVEAACAMARDLQPAMVVLEDVDLVAMERGHPQAVTPLLFSLLNEMDGLAEDADVVFLLTTNRPDLLEPALAARPGRVDEAIALPFPDADGRRRLIALYARGLDIDADLEPFVAATAGGSPALIKEWLRRAALRAAERDGAGPLRVGAAELSVALEELRGRAELFGARAAD